MAFTRLNRKGLSYDAVLEPLIAVLAILVFIGLVVAYKVPLTNVAKEGTCTGTSTITWFLYSLRGVNVINQNHNTQLSTNPSSFCNPVLVTFKKSASENTVKKVVADEMAQCWKSYNRGKYPFYEVDPGKQMYCVVCAKIDFSKDRGKTINNFQDYLYSNIVDPIKGTSYLEYLNNADLNNRSLAPYTGNSMTIDTNNDYAILMTQSTDASFIKYLFKKGTTLQQVIYGAGVGAGVGGTLALVATGIIVTTVSASAAVVAAPALLIGGVVLGGVAGEQAAHAGSNVNILGARIVLMPWDNSRLNDLGCYKRDAASISQN